MSILQQIADSTRRRIAEQKKQIPLSKLQRMISRQYAPKDFRGALQGLPIKLIGEIKRASPSKGWLREELDLTHMICCYVEGGAAAISVLTEPSFFKGSLDDLAQVCEQVDLPLLRKDFILDSYQIFEARAYGADAVLLIASILSSSELKELMDVAHDLQLSALVEVHDESELEAAQAVGAVLIGINNRNLSDFSVDLGTTLKLLPLLHPETIVVSESGIKSHGDIMALQDAGVHAVLVGEALVTSDDPRAKIRELMG